MVYSVYTRLPRADYPPAVATVKTLRTLLGPLQDHGVQFVVSGAAAASLHGLPVAVPAVELCYQQNWSNCECLANALEEMGAEPLPRTDYPVPITGLLRQASQPTRFTVAGAKLDLLPRVPGLGTFEDLHSDAEVVRHAAGGMSARALSLEQLIRWLQISGGGGHEQVELMASLYSSSALRFSTRHE